MAAGSDNTGSPFPARLFHALKLMGAGTRESPHYWKCETCGMAYGRMGSVLLDKSEPVDGADCQQPNARLE
jgi:hypothetical protein